VVFVKKYIMRYSSVEGMSALRWCHRGVVR